MMNIINFTKEEAREFLKQEALKEISEVVNFTLFDRRVFCIIAKYGLQLEAKGEGLLNGDEWTNPACRETLLKRVEQFLDKHIR